jgi:hypothetical protein
MTSSIVEPPRNLTWERRRSVDRKESIPAPPLDRSLSPIHSAKKEATPIICPEKRGDTDYLPLDLALLVSGFGVEVLPEF